MSEPIREQLAKAPGNTVLYSEKAWAVLRKESGGSDMWITDRASHTSYSLTTEEAFEWTDDWVRMVPVMSEVGGVETKLPLDPAPYLSRDLAIRMTSRSPLRDGSDVFAPREGYSTDPKDYR